MKFILTLIFLFVQFFSLSAEQLAGWEHKGLGGKRKTKKGVLLSGYDVLFSSPVVADLDSNITNGLETVVVTADGVVAAIAASGDILWQRKLPIYSCTGTEQKDKAYSAPAVGELFSDGVKYVVVGYGSMSKKCKGGVVALRAENGSIFWKFNLKKFSITEDFDTPIGTAVFSTPALGDVDGDGNLEIGFGSFDRNVYIMDAWGHPIWYYHAADSVWSSGTFVDVDGSGNKEFVIGTDITRNTNYTPATPNGGYVYAFRLNLDPKPSVTGSLSVSPYNLVKYEFLDSDAYLWKTEFDQVISSSPAIADILPSETGLEIVVGSGCFFPENNTDKNGRWLKILSLADGSVLQTLTAPACITASPALGDIDEDGDLEVVILSSGNVKNGGDGESRILAYDPDNSDPLWETIPRERGSNDSSAGYFSSAVIADLDANGSLEIIAGNGAGLVILAGKTGEQLSCPLKSCSDKPGYSTLGQIKTTPAVADLDQDGTLEVVAPSKKKYKQGRFGLVQVFTGFETELQSETGILTPQSTPWPMFKLNAERNALIE